METNKLLSCVQKIKNIRKYKSELLTDEDKQYLYKAYSYGHSSMGNFARELLVVEQNTIREKIVVSTLSPYMVKEKNNQSWIKDAPFLAVTLVDERRATARVGDIGLKVAIMEAEGALQNLRLIAISLGIGTTIVREFDTKVLHDQLNFPWYIHPTAIITAGYNDNIQNILPFLEQKEIIHKDEWT